MKKIKYIIGYGLCINFMKLRIRIKVFFKWYDMRVGVYCDTENKILYICPIPMVAITIADENVWW